MHFSRLSNINVKKAIYLRCLVSVVLSVVYIDISIFFPHLCLTILKNAKNIHDQESVSLKETPCTQSIVAEHQVS